VVHRGTGGDLYPVDRPLARRSRGRGPVVLRVLINPPAWPVRSRSGRCRSFWQGRPACPLCGLPAGRRGTICPPAERSLGRDAEPVFRQARAAAGPSGGRGGPPPPPAPPGPERQRRSARPSPPVTGRGPLEDQAASNGSPGGALEVEGRLVSASNATLYCGNISYQGTPGGGVRLNRWRVSARSGTFPAGHPGRAGVGRLRGVPGPPAGHLASHAHGRDGPFVPACQAVDRRRRHHLPDSARGSSDHHPLRDMAPSRRGGPPQRPTASLATCCPCPTGPLTVRHGASLR